MTQINIPAASCAIIYVNAFDFPILPDASAQAVIAGLKCPPDILPPRPIAIASAATINTGLDTKDTVPIKRLVPRNSTNAGVYILYLKQMKYLVVKGWLGFGDRLESLKMAISYALKYNLQIYVDWTDSTWSHGTESFYTYFKLVNIPILNSLDDIPSDATVFPTYWKNNLKIPMSDELANKRDEFKLNIGQLSGEYPADVIVLANLGLRQIFEDSTFFSNTFRVNHPRILDTIKQRNSQFNLSKCIGIHIRGTDRIKNEYKRQLSIQSLAINTTMHGGHSGKGMICVSDDKESYELWKRFFPQTILMSSISLEHSSSKGNHHISKNELKISKDEMNVDMLIDFFTLAMCEFILPTYRDSRFAKEASRLRPYIKIICGL